MSENPGQEFDVVTPDVPMPQGHAVKTGPVDEFDAAFKFAFIGAGQGGGRLAESFWRLGYRRVAALNTAEQDMATLSMPKLCLGGGGAGKNPAVAAALVQANKEDVLDFMRRSFGPDFNRVIILAGAGGGTGAGSCIQLVDVAIELQKSIKATSQKVGVVVALPKVSEGKKVNANAFGVLKELWRLVELGFVSPLVVVDNEKINTLYPNLAVDPFWDTANTSISSLFHVFNTIAIKNSSYTAFDRNDYGTILDSGLMVFGVTPVARWADATDVSYAVRVGLQQNILSGGIDLATGSVAGAIIIGGQQVLCQVPQAHLDHAFEQLTRLLKAGSTVHRGIYRGSKESLTVYTVVGGLGQPTAKLDELRRLGDLA